MKSQGFIFGGGTGVTQDNLERKRKMADALLRKSMGTPKTAIEGIDAIISALGARKINKGITEHEAASREEFEEAAGKYIKPNIQGMIDVASSPHASASHRKVMEALMKGKPNFARGGTMRRKGEAVVGEFGPEVVELPRGAKVIPMDEQKRMKEFGPGYDPGYESDDPMANGQYVKPLKMDDYLRHEMGVDAAKRYESLSPNDQIEFLNDPANGFVAPPEDLTEVTPEEMLMSRAKVEAQSLGKSSQLGAPEQGVQVADASGGFEGFAPAGVSEETQRNSAANAYRTLIAGLDDYNAMVQEGGAPLLPGEQKDNIKVSRRNLQMQMKELYNLGVLNGPDLALMDEILINPVGIQNKLLDVFGIADTEERVENNVEQVRRIMTQMVEPKLLSMGMKPQDLVAAPQKADLSTLSDDELLKLLGGG